MLVFDEWPIILEMKSISLMKGRTNNDLHEIEYTANSFLKKYIPVLEIEVALARVGSNQQTF